MSSGHSDRIILRRFIRESLQGIPLQEGFTPDPYVDYQKSDSKSGGVNPVDAVMTAFSSGFDSDQKNGIGDNSIIGSKVSTTKLGEPQFVVLCKMRYDNRDIIVAKKYSKATNFSLSPWGKLLDPDVLLHGKITKLPSPSTNYDIHKIYPFVADLSSRINTPNLLFTGIKKRPTTSLINWANDEKVRAEAERQYDLKEKIKTFDTTAFAKAWVEQKIGQFNNKNFEEINELNPVVKQQWKLTPVESIDFETGKSGKSFVIDLSPDELYDKFGLFEFNPESKVFPPPFSFTVEGITSKFEGECNLDAKEFITQYGKFLSGDLSDDQGLNLAICSNEYASSLAVDIATSLAALIPGVGEIVVPASLATQFLALVQLLIYQIKLKDYDSAVFTIIRMAFLILPGYSGPKLIGWIVSAFQIVCDLIGSVAVDTEWVKKWLKVKGINPDDTAQKINDAYDLENVTSMISKIPTPL